MKKIVKMALEAKEAGYTRLASVVKSFRGTTYYHVVLIEDILREGSWIPAPRGIFPSGAHGRMGLSGSQIDWKTTRRRFSRTPAHGPGRGK